MGLFSRKRSRADVDVIEDEDEVDEPDDEVEVEDAEAEPAASPAADEEPEEIDAEEVDELDAVETDDDIVEPDDRADVDEDDDESEADGPAADDEELEDTGQVEFELSDWGARERQMIDSELAAARVRRAWEAGTLVVAASDADVVDDLIDYLEERIALDLSPDVEPVIYEVGDWPPGLEERFLELLIEERIAHMRGYREITVGVDDEERVDALVEKVTAAWEDEQPTDAELDGPDTQEVLSELFVSSDRLLHDPSDRAATVRFDDAAESAQTMALPFGFDEAGWGAITDLVGALRDTLGEAESTDDEVVEAATALRSHLRPLV